MPVSLCNTYGVAAPSKTFGFLQVQMHLLMHRNVCGHLWVIHLDEVNANFAWNIFPKVYVPECVKDEVTAAEKPGSRMIRGSLFLICTATDEIRVTATGLVSDHRMTMNDSLVLATAIDGDVKLLLTDDLDLRDVAKRFGILPVGTVGILLRAFREGLCEIREFFTLLDRLNRESSLYVTDDIILMIKKAAKDFRGPIP